MKNKYNIIFINSLRNWGGGEIWMLKIAKALRNRDHNTLIICRKNSRLEYYSKQQSQPFKAISFRSDYDPFVILNLTRIFNNFVPDIIIPNLDKEIKLSAVAAKLSGQGKVVPRRGNEFPVKNKWRYRIFYERLIEKLIVNCQATKDILIKNSAWLNPDKVTVIYNGIESEHYIKKYDTRKFRDEFNFPNDCIVVGMIGELNERKGHIYLFEAAEKILAQNSNVRFLIVGVGDAEKELKAIINRMQLQDYFCFTGFRSDLPVLFNLIDIVVLPSLNEGMPNVLIEAMAAAKPVVATDVSGIPELVDDKIMGFLVPLRDSKQLAIKIKDLINTEELRHSMGIQGRKRVEQIFSYEKMLNNYEDLFDEVVN